VLNSLIFKYYWKARVATVICDPQRRHFSLNFFVVLVLVKVYRKLLNSGSKFPDHSLVLRPDVCWTVNRLSYQIQLQAWSHKLQCEFNSRIRNAFLVCWIITTI